MDINVRFMPSDNDIGVHCVLLVGLAKTIEFLIDAHCIIITLRARARPLALITSLIS